MSSPENGHTYENLDVPIEPPAESGEYEVIPTGAYIGTLKAFRQTETPPWKLIQQQTNKPEKEPDKLQWEWTFEITDGEYAGETIPTWTTRSWHQRANAAAIACGLLGVSELPRGSGLSTGKLIGKPCQIWIVEKPKDDGTSRSYVDKVLPIPQRRRQTAATAPVVSASEPVAATLYEQRRDAGQLQETQLEPPFPDMSDAEWDKTAAEAPLPA